MNILESGVRFRSLLQVSARTHEGRPTILSQPFLFLEESP